MRKILGLGLMALFLVAGNSRADDVGTFTKDEAFLTLAVHSKILHALYSPEMRKASIAGHKSVVPSLVMRVTDADGQAIDNGNLPPVLANLQADLKNTDIVGELRNAGLQIDADTSVVAPRLVIFVMSIPAVDKPNLKTRKMYLITGMVQQVMTVGLGLFGKRESLTTGTFGHDPILSALDDTTDAQAIRVAVRKIVDEYIADSSTKAVKR